MLLLNREGNAALRPTLYTLINDKKQKLRMNISKKKKRKNSFQAFPKETKDTLKHQTIFWLPKILILDQLLKSWDLLYQTWLSTMKTMNKKLNTITLSSILQLIMQINWKEKIQETRSSKQEVIIDPAQDWRRILKCWEILKSTRIKYLRDKKLWTHT